MARVIAEEALVAEPGVIRVRLIEDVGVTARRALDDRAFDKGLLSQAALFPFNENKMSDGGPVEAGRLWRVSLQMNVWKSNQKWHGTRSAVRSIVASLGPSVNVQSETISNPDVVCCTLSVDPKILMVSGLVAELP